MRKIRLDGSCLNHLTNIPVDPHAYIHSEKSYTKYIMYFADCGCVRTWRNLYRYATGRQLIALLLTIKNKETKHHRHTKHKWQTGKNSASYENTLSPGLVRLLWPLARRRIRPYSYNPGARMRLSTWHKILPLWYDYNALWYEVMKTNRHKSQPTTTLSHQ